MGEGRERERREREREREKERESERERERDTTCKCKIQGYRVEEKTEVKTYLKSVEDLGDKTANLSPAHLQINVIRKFIECGDAWTSVPQAWLFLHRASLVKLISVSAGKLGTNTDLFFGLGHR